MAARRARKQPPTGDAAARALGGDVSRIVSEREDWAGYAEFGGNAHKRLLGIAEGALDDADAAPKELARLRRTLAAAPEPTAPASKRPVDSAHYTDGATVRDGWVRKGR